MKHETTVPGLPSDFPSFPDFAPGEVWLVGAGPGDPRLLTLMALHALREADTIIHDALIAPGALGLACPDATIRSVGKRGGQPSPQQSEITEQLIGLARQGRKVLRLKGGDPFVFGRGGEEASALADAGIPFRIVPGLTSGLAGAALAGIPATTRDTNHAVILATGYRAEGHPDEQDWEAIARTGQPVILYMAMARLEGIVAGFLRADADPQLPVAIVASATLPDERIVETSLSSAVEDVRTNEIGAPAIVVIGHNAKLGQTLRAALVDAVP
ncbi:Uroporphyrinogen-III C-methyltransferase [Methyloligella halotolerans]|uniref:uroporphyrinogen-III C-methyltransferase n=1 Tax=Methyloligella halotolerans TaxID=1177755 RepID=A0A1E2S183_9HYPH|nr:uroporphyrinogen-III C-methyltransferase [Methyloligella halotolerans]ODA68256.1 Uroporphyrinogen-III C-methyltransferase [Methyloligella halotolerans]